MTAKKTSSSARYELNENGRFIIENYNESKLFSNFFPGVAGVWGIPMWAFYVNGYDPPSTQQLHNSIKTFCELPLYPILSMPNAQQVGSWYHHSDDWYYRGCVES